VVNYAASQAGAEAVVSEITAAGGRAIAVRADVSKAAEAQALIEAAVAQFGRLDVLVNNAGITGLEGGHVSHDPEHTQLEDWHRVMRTNLDGVFLGCKHAIATMRQTGTGGSIINMSSRSGLVGVPHASAYAASKAAIRNHSKTVALYCAEEGLNIRCNSIYPASIRTPMWDAMIRDIGEEKAMLKEMPLHRFGRPEEVAAVAVMLASDEATYITGSEFNIDGGVLAGSAAAPK